jgi:hypothetical protein
VEYLVTAYVRWLRYANHGGQCEGSVHFVIVDTDGTTTPRDLYEEMVKGAMVEFKQVAPPIVVRWDFHLNTPLSTWAAPKPEEQK